MVKEDDKSIEEVFHLELRALWSAESMLVEALPRMINNARNEGLKNLLRYHFAETDQHKVALEMICKRLGIQPEGYFNAQLKEILDEGETIMAKDSSDSQMDTALIAVARKVERFEIEAYVVAAEHAETLSHNGIAQRLRLTLEEERQADAKLSFVDKSVINPTAKLEDAMVHSE